MTGGHVSCGEPVGTFRNTGRSRVIRRMDSKQLFKNRAFRYGIFAAIPILIITFLFLIWFLGDDRKPPPSSSREQIAGSTSDSFSFFDLNSATRYSDGLRTDLKDKLGPDTYETRTMVDLELHEKGFLEANFPELNALNRQLNYLPGERVEHDTLQLTYRYARHEHTPFEYVRIMFSKASGAPLFIKILSKQEGASVLESIRAKYGASTLVAWADGTGKTNVWERHGDVLLISETRNRIGTPTYYFGFYFINNIKALIESEQSKRVRERKELEKSGKTAF